MLSVVVVWMVVDLLLVAWLVRSAQPRRPRRPVPAGRFHGAARPRRPVQFARRAECPHTRPSGDPSRRRGRQHS